MARELVTLQEKLDLLVTKMPREATQPDLDPKIDTLSGVAMQVMQNKGAGIVENSVETGGDDGMNMKEQGQSQLSQNSQPSVKISQSLPLLVKRCMEDVKMRSENYLWKVTWTLQWQN